MSENSSSIDLTTLWVEYKNPDGRIYYYNAKTRQTTWTKPEGQRVMSQSELDQLLSNQNESPKTLLSPVENDQTKEMSEPIQTDVAPPNDPVPPNYNPYAYPPPSLGMPFGAIPPHLMPHMAQMMQNTFPGFGPIPPPPHLLRFMMPPFLNPSSATTGKSLETLHAELKKLRSQLKELETKMEKTNTEASVWSEFKNPEGRPYYYNSKTTESTWDKPLVLKDVIDLQNQLELVNKSIHESEKEVKRLESEQSQLAAAAAAANSNAKQQQTQQQPAVPTPSFLNGFTLEKLDNSEIQRFGEASLIADRSSATDKTKNKARPISTKPIPGTPWCIVWTSDNQTFFFNPTSRTSLWDRPDELKGRMDVDEMILAAMPQEDAATNNRTTATKQKLDSSTSNETEPDTKKVKPDVTSTTTITTTTTTSLNGNEVHDNQTTNSLQESNNDAEAKAAKQRELIPYETRIKQFREMLAEKQVSAFATWEQEKNKIENDPRYALLTAKERKQEFDRYTHERADEERREIEAKIKLKKKDFRDLLKESNVSIKTTYSEFSSRHSKDERFRAVEKIRDREAWFHDYIQELKTKEKDGSSRHSEKEKLKKDFFALLKELKVAQNSSWSDIKHAGEHDQRYKAIESSSRREDWFREYQEKHANETTTSKEKNEEELERQREKERQERIDASIKKRTEEVKEQLSGFQRELDKEREHLKRDKAIENFKALLTDMVRTADAEWKETKKKLKKDPRWEQDLDRSEKERLFEAHVMALEKKRKTAFHALLSEHCTLTSTWKEVKKAIKSDPRFEKIFSNERKRDLEKEFEDYMKKKYQKAKEEFRELLRETKLITHKSLKMIRESEEQNHLRDIEKILQKDKRCLLLDVIPEQRSEILMDYLRELEVRGTPPPPTASADRRK